ncbi:esterase/lipase family protein [Parahaliea mediterranea]|uniref:esterase/lipase family protein n=1 Tax=Parahaliea mediterranea TaxID=651086 RepID=UPI0013002800|nr:alpha/beta hydrolase [Parahaliea mediterranea]
MSDEMTTIRPPLTWPVSEARFVYESAMLPLLVPLLHTLPRGESNPVLVLPGYLASDRSTLAIRGWLRGLGYTTYSSGIKRNTGLDKHLVAQLRERLDSIADSHAKPVRLVGWSLGGIHARLLAHEMPDLVDRVVTLASPFRIPAGHPVNGPIVKIYKYLKGNGMDSLSDPDAVWQHPPPVPCTAVYSYSDGIASWDYCIDPLGSASVENVGVNCSHLGMGSHPLVMYLLADRLAGAAENWKAFELSGWRKRAYTVEAGHGIPGENGFGVRSFSLGTA